MSAKGLGRGLSALFGDDPVIEEVSSSGSMLRISDIEPNPGTTAPAFRSGRVTGTRRIHP